MSVATGEAMTGAAPSCASSRARRRAAAASGSGEDEAERVDEAGDAERERAEKRSERRTLCIWVNWVSGGLV